MKWCKIIANQLTQADFLQAYKIGVNKIEKRLKWSRPRTLLVELATVMWMTALDIAKTLLTYGHQEKDLIKSKTK